MNVSSTVSSSYYAQMQQNNSKVQSQSGASGMPPPSNEAGYNSIMQLASTQLMTMLDTNQNGSIDKAEFSDAAKQLSQSAQNSNTDNAFNAIDSNGDGQINATEFLDVLKQLSSKQKAQKTTERLEYSMKEQIPVDKKSNDLQSVLMKQILSAYGNSTTSNSVGLSIKA